MTVRLAGGGKGQGRGHAEQRAEFGVTSKPSDALCGMGGRAGALSCCQGVMWMGLPGRDESACTLSRCPPPAPTFSSEGVLSHLPCRDHKYNL